ncbi:aldo/keto reductase [Jatrophihabitans sp. YIM 134969]
MATPEIPSLPFHHGHAGAIPIVGFGTWQARGDDAYESVTTALELGYRHVDTAWMYRNHTEVGRAMTDSGVARDDVFLTTKIPPDRAGQARATLEKSLEDLQTDHLDLWLIHWSDGSALVPLWEQLLQAREDGLARAVGVSNYSISQIDELTKATGVAPALDQVRWGPPDYDPGFAADLTERGVVLEGYSALKITDLDDPALVRIAEEHAVTVPQVIFRWHVQHDVVAIPKSVKPERIAQNLDVFDFELSDDQMAEVDALADR